MKKVTHPFTFRNVMISITVVSTNAQLTWSKQTEAVSDCEQMCAIDTAIYITPYSAIVLQITNNVKFGASLVVLSANGNWSPKPKSFVTPHGGTTQGQVTSNVYYNSVSNTAPSVIAYTCTFHSFLLVFIRSVSRPAVALQWEYLSK